ncbi:hypothetical protein EMIT0111MI5_60099 [Burkholderia sp. IT-111MI5]
MSPSPIKLAFHDFGDHVDRLKFPVGRGGHIDSLRI